MIIWKKQQTKALRHKLGFSLILKLVLNPVLNLFQDYFTKVLCSYSIKVLLYDLSRNFFLLHIFIQY